MKWNEMEKKIFLKFLEGGFGILDLRGKIGNSGLVWYDWDGYGEKNFFKNFKIRFFNCGFWGGPNIVYVYRKTIWNM